MAGAVPENELKSRPFLTRIEIKGVKIFYDTENTWKEYKQTAGYQSSEVIFVDFEEGEMRAISRLDDTMVNGEVDIRKEIFMGYID